MPKHKKKTDGSDPKNAANAAAAAKTYSGVIREVTDKSFDIETTDTRILTIQLTDTTEKPGELKVGQGVDVEATQDDNGLFQAVKIKLNPEVVKTIIQNYGAGAQEEGRTAPPPTILVRPGPTHDADDSGPPKIKRGRPVAQASKPKDDEDDDAASPAPSTARPPEPAKSVAPAPAAPAINPRQAFVEKARTVAASYVEGLPNYICQEFATRYESQTRNPSWNAIDVVSAEVVY